MAAPKDSTTRAAKDGPVWSHCPAPAVRYEGKCGADSAHANHSENEPSMKGLIEPSKYLVSSRQIFVVTYNPLKYITKNAINQETLYMNADKSYM